MLRALSGHVWTVAPFVADLVRAPRPPSGEAWETRVEDPRVGAVRLTGVLHAPPGARDVLVVVHGLGGSMDSSYVVRAAHAALAAGLAVLRLNVRGAPRDGEDIHHAALTEDLRAAIASPALARFERVLALGFSLGAHLVLRHATEAHDARLRAVAAVCAPIDLDPAAVALDQPARAPYRHHLLRGLREIYLAVHRRRPGPVAPADLRAIRTLREWDARVVAPRFGFASAEDYYEKASVGPRLGAVAVPALVAQARWDPMVLPSAAGSLARVRAPLEVRWIDRGGHVGFPRDVTLGERAPPGLEPQLVAWLARAGT